MGNYSQDEIYHHGILGQKWGVRRYQNSDGSLTEAGKRHRIEKEYFNSDGTLTPAAKKKLNKLVDDYENSNERSVSLRTADNPWELTDVGIRRLDNDSDLISKGSIASRVTGADESVDHKRKYVAVTKFDKNYYKTNAYEFVNDYKDIRIDTYEFKKDVRVANGKRVVEEIINMYGDKALNDVYLDLPTGDINRLRANRKINEQNPSSRERILLDYVTEGNNKIGKLLQDKLFKGQKAYGEVFNRFRQLGYDAIVDAEDYFLWSQVLYPLIVLDPAESMTRVKSEKLFQ